MPTNPTHKSELSLEALADLQVASDVRISPDGTKVAYALRAFCRKTENAISSIWIADVGTAKSTRQLTSGLFNDETPQWSPDGASLLATPAENVSSFPSQCIAPSGVRIVQRIAANRPTKKSEMCRKM